MATRKITTLDRNGTPTRQLSFEEVRHGVLRRAGVEFQLYDKRPKRVVCTGAGCGKIINVPRTGKVPDQCLRCRRKAKYGDHAPEVRYRFLAKMVAIMKLGRIKPWVPMSEYKKRYGERPLVEWLVKVGLRTQ